MPTNTISIVTITTLDLLVFMEQENLLLLLKLALSGNTHLGPKHMQRLARYPLEIEKKIMKMMYQASWAKKTGRFKRGCTLHSMKRGMKITRKITIKGSRELSFPGCVG